jgi:3-hydroxybutyryl-CoA dehydrogenase
MIGRVTESAIRRVGVLGSGLMGAGIAELCARRGCSVVVVEIDKATADLGRAKVAKSLDVASSRGKITVDEHQTALANLGFTADWDALADRQLVIEAITERLDVKLTTFARLDQTVTSADAILASNTSSIPIMKLAAVTGRPENVVGLHFFNPVQVLPLVEVIASLATSATTCETVTTFAVDVLGKHVVRAKDRSGFVVNALLVPYLLSAIRMLESGFASAEDIDAGMVHGCAHPMGPLALADLIGLDTTMAVAESMYSEFKEPLYAPPPLLSRMVEGGCLGRKSGRGFFEYPLV